MSGIRRTLAAVVAAASWGCGGSTQPDATQPVVADIVVSPAAPTMTINTQLPLQALVRNAAGDLVPDASVTWTVENATIASVTPAGVVTALAVGTTQVAASARGKSGIATVTVQRAPVASVVVLPSSVSAGLGGTTQLMAKAYDASQNELSGRAMVWTTSNAGVVTVDANGLVTAKAIGTGTITATAEGKSGTSQFTISPGAVSKVTVTPGSLSMETGQTQHLAATAEDANGAVLADRTAIWSSDNTQVVTVFGGAVTAVGRGTAKISATVDGVSGSATVTVANAPVQSVTVAPASVVVGSKVQLTATVRDTRGVVVTDRAVTWSVPANNGVASIDASTGEVTGLAAGTVTATATSEGKSGSATVTVTAPAVKSVTVAPSAPSVDVGKTQQFSATVTDVNNNTVTDRPVTWSSSNTAVATIDANSGLATVVSAGTTTITATSGGVSGTTTLTGVPVVTSVEVAPASPSIVQNASTTLTATVKDGAGNSLSGQTITWTSSDPSVASLSATSGGSVTVTGGLAGTATITATSSAKSGTATVTVTSGTVASVVVTLGSNTLKSNETTTATAVALDANNRPLQGRTVAWFASGGATITASSTVTSTGANSSASATVKGKNVSSNTSATISATISSKSGSATLTVTP